MFETFSLQVIKMLVVVVVLFGICWLPLHVFILVIDFNPHLIEDPSPSIQQLFTGTHDIFTLSFHFLCLALVFTFP